MYESFRSTVTPRCGGGSWVDGEKTAFGSCGTSLSPTSGEENRLWDRLLASTGSLKKAGDDGDLGRELPAVLLPWVALAGTLFPDWDAMVLPSCLAR